MEPTAVEKLLARWAEDPEFFTTGAVTGALVGADVLRWEAVAPTLDEARRRVLQSNTLAFLRRGAVLVHAAVVPFDAELEAIAGNPRLSDQGQREARGAVLARRDAALEQVVQVFDRAAEQLTHSDFPVPRPSRIADPDTARITVAVVRAPHLGLPELEAELEQALARGDASLLEALLPLARTRRSRGESDPDYRRELAEMTMGDVLPTFDGLIARAEGVLVGVDRAAHVLARALVQRLRHQLEMVILEVQKAGRWAASTMLRLVDERGVPRGICPDLDPPPAPEVGPPA